MTEFGDYIVFVDESGDHGLVAIDPQYPVFVLAFCIFAVNAYVDQIVPSVERLKFEFFGHDMVVLHEHEIRKSKPPFDILLNPRTRATFMSRLTDVVDAAPFTVVACVIDKVRFRQKFALPTNPYHVALEFGLEQVYMHLRESQRGRLIHVIFESRGKREDGDLEQEFGRIMRHTTLEGMEDALRFRCASKQANSSGLQLADMVARPVGLHVLRPNQSNRVWSIVESKLRHSIDGRVDGWGLKTYP